MTREEKLEKAKQWAIVSRETDPKKKMVDQILSDPYYDHSYSKKELLGMSVKALEDLMIEVFEEFENESNLSDI